MGAYPTYVGVIDSIQQFEVEYEACSRTTRGRRVGAVVVKLYAYSGCEVSFDM